jgi:HrpA-like RNA helicase
LKIIKENFINELKEIINQNPNISERLALEWNHHKVMILFRKFEQALPLYGHQYNFNESLNKDNIVVLSGATGCGKSVLAPQMAREFLDKQSYSLDAKVMVVTRRTLDCYALAQRLSQ